MNELDEKIRKLDKYYHDDDFEFRGIRNIQNLFKSSIDENYYKPTLVKSGYNSNYIEYQSKGDKMLMVKEYLGLIEPYLANMINDYKSKGEWKIQLTAEIKFTSLKSDSDETRIMHTKSDSTENMIGSDTNEVIKELFKSFLQRYQEGLQKKMRGSEFEFDGNHLLYYDINKISLNRGGSYIESAKWIKDKKSTINPKNNDYKCFQYAVTVALNRDKIKKDRQRVSKIKPFIDQYSWNDIYFPSTGKDWKKFELNNESIALNILYVPHKTGKIHLACKSKHNLTHEKQIILLMITDGEKWHYTAVTRLSELLRGLAGNKNGDFDCLNCFHAYRTKNKLETHKKVCENHDYCHVEMPNEDNNIIKYNQGEKSIKSPFIIYADLERLLEKISTCYKIIKYNQGEKSIKSPFIIYADLECLLEKISTCYNNAEESSTTEINKHTPSGYSLFTHCSFDKTKNKLDYYSGDDCMKKFCKDLREHTTKIINYEKKDMIPFTKKEEKHHNKQKFCYICKKEFNTDDSDKKHHKVKDHCHHTGKYRGAAHNICSLRYRIPKEIPIVFHNGSKYDYHFIIKELVKEFYGNFECLGENTEKYITFSVPLNKEIKNKNKIIEITYKIKFIDSYRFMSTSLSKPVGNLSEGIHNNRCVDCKSCLEYMKNKNEKLIFRCFSCTKNYEKDFNKELIERFANIYEFCNGDLNKFILLLRKGVYPYEYMDNLEKENVGEYHDLYVQSDTLLLADIFENFRNMCIKVYELDPAHLLSLPGLAWQACLKKTNVKLELLTDYDMLLMVEEGIRGGMCHSIHRCAKANNKYLKKYDKNKEP